MTKLQKRMKNLFKEYKYSWNATENLLQSCFEIFCEFYENGGIEIIDWSIDEEHKEVKKQLDHLYFYWTILRNKHLKKLDYILDKFYGHGPIFEKNNLNFKEKWKLQDKYLDDVFSEKELLFYSKLEFLINENDNKNLKLLILLKDWMMT